MPIARSLAAFLAMAALSNACGPSETNSAETAGPADEVPAQTAEVTSDTASGTPEPTSTSAPTSTATSPALDAVTPESTPTPGSDSEWEMIGSVYRENCTQRTVDRFGGELASTAAEFCQCSYGVLRVNLAYGEFAEYQSLHTQGDESRYDILSPHARDEQEACYQLFDDVIDWRISEDSDRLTGIQRLTAVNRSYDHDFEPPYDDDPAELLVQCAGGSSLLVAISMGGQFISAPTSYRGYPTDNVRVAYRLNDGPVVEKSWLDSERFDNEWIVAPDSEELAFVRSLRSGGELVFRAWNFDDSVVGTVAFNNSGAAWSVSQVLQECGY